MIQIESIKRVNNLIIKVIIIKSIDDGLSQEIKDVLHDHDDQFVFVVIDIKMNDDSLIQLFDYLQYNLFESNVKVLLSPMINSSQLMKTIQFIKSITINPTTTTQSINNDQLIYLILNIPTLIDYYNDNIDTYPTIEDFFDTFIAKFTNIKHLLNSKEFTIN